jgi:hypothetical protein
VALVAPCLERADRLRLAAADAPLRGHVVGCVTVAFAIVTTVIVEFAIVTFAIVTFVTVTVVVVDADAELELDGDQTIELAVGRAADDLFDPSVQGLEPAADLLRDDLLEIQEHVGKSDDDVGRLPGWQRVCTTVGRGSCLVRFLVRFADLTGLYDHLTHCGRLRVTMLVRPSPSGVVGSLVPFAMQKVVGSSPSSAPKTPVNREFLFFTRTT